MEEYYIVLNDGEEELMYLHLYHPKFYTEEEILTLIKQIGKSYLELNKDEGSFIKEYMEYELTNTHGFRYSPSVNIYKYNIN